MWRTIIGYTILCLLVWIECIRWHRCWYRQLKSFHFHVCLAWAHWLLWNGNETRLLPYLIWWLLADLKKITQRERGREREIVVIEKIKVMRCHLINRVLNGERECCRFSGLMDLNFVTNKTKCHKIKWFYFLSNEAYAMLQYFDFNNSPRIMPFIC